MKFIIALVLICVLAPATYAQGFGKKKAVESAATPAVTPAPTKADAKAAKAPKGKSWSGTVCTLVGCAGGKNGNVSKADAKKSVDHNELLCLCVKNKCYIILNGDGTNASGKLADLAGGNVTVTGKMLAKGGVSVILADSIK